MKKLLKQKTKKLFYGKWPYKIATMCQGGCYIKIYGLTKCKLMFEDNSLHRNFYRKFDKVRLTDFCGKYELFVNEHHQIRAEGNHVNFFVDDEVLYKKIIEIMGDFVVEVTEPESNAVLQMLKSNKKIVVVDELPFGKYNSRIVFKEMPLNQRENLAELLKKYGDDSLRMSITTKRYLNGERHYMQDPFIYVEDEKILTLLALAANGYIKKTEKFVLKSSINTCLDQEQPCQPLVKA